METKTILKRLCEVFLNFDEKLFIEHLEYIVEFDNYIREIKKERLNYLGFPPETLFDEVEWDISVKLNVEQTTLASGILDNDEDLYDYSEEMLSEYVKHLENSDFLFDVLSTFVETKKVEIVVETSEYPNKNYGRKMVISYLAKKMEIYFDAVVIIEQLEKLEIGDHLDALKAELLLDYGYEGMKISDVPFDAWDYEFKVKKDMNYFASIIYDRYYYEDNFEEKEDFVFRVIDDELDSKTFAENAFNAMDINVDLGKEFEINN